jgi:hypothetical protein
MGKERKGRGERKEGHFENEGTRKEKKEKKRKKEDRNANILPTKDALHLTSLICE